MAGTLFLLPIGLKKDPSPLSMTMIRIEWTVLLGGNEVAFNLPEGTLNACTTGTIAL